LLLTAFPPALLAVDGTWLLGIVGRAFPVHAGFLLGTRLLRYGLLLIATKPCFAMHGALLLPLSHAVLLLVVWPLALFLQR
jgi:hypothetical protein